MNPFLPLFHSVDYFLCRCLLVDRCLSRTWFWSLRHYSQFTISTRAKSASCGDMHSLIQCHTRLLTAFIGHKRDDPKTSCFWWLACHLLLSLLVNNLFCPLRKLIFFKSLSHRKDLNCYQGLLLNGLNLQCCFDNFDISDNPGFLCRKLWGLLSSLGRHSTQHLSLEMYPTQHR